MWRTGLWEDNILKQPHFGNVLTFTLARVLQISSPRISEWDSWKISAHLRKEKRILGTSCPDFLRLLQILPHIWPTKSWLQTWTEAFNPLNSFHFFIFDIQCLLNRSCSFRVKQTSSGTLKTGNIYLNMSSCEPQLSSSDIWRGNPTRTSEGEDYGGGEPR